MRWEISGGAEGEWILALSGRLDSGSTGGVWRAVIPALRSTEPRAVVVDCGGVEYCDGAGLGLLVEIRRLQQARGGNVEIRGLRAEARSLLDSFRIERLREDEERPRKTGLVTVVGKATAEGLRESRAMVAFVGQMAVELGGALLNPRRVRWKDALLAAEKAGVDAVPILALIGVLMGLILAFQAAIPMKMFGAQVFVADVVSVAMLREMGPLMTAVILAGRTGSAFAAEIGTMKVNEEIDALSTMGLSPVRFLALPRTVAVFIVMPFLSAFTSLCGLVGGGIVMLSLGFPLVTYLNQIEARVGMGDFLGGLAKAMVFGILVAGIGCLRGLRTAQGPSAVGESTTRAVVAGMVLIVATDGIFSTVYYYLGI